MTTPTAESKTKAKMLLLEDLNVTAIETSDFNDAKEAIALALDAAKEAGRKEVIAEASAIVKRYIREHMDNGMMGLTALVGTADAIAALTATHGTKNKKTPPRAE